MTRRVFLHAKGARRIVLVLALAVVGAVLSLRLLSLARDGFPSVGESDFAIYWSGGWLVRYGGNPYDPAALVAAERVAGLEEPDPGLNLWNPPWMMALVLPLAFLPFWLATATWFLVQFGLFLACGAALWRYYAPGDRRTWIGLVLGAGFMPGLYGLRMGQMSVWLLLGVAGFLIAERAGRDVLAGAALALLTIKPHITYLFWLAALWWIFLSKRWYVLLGWLAALASAGGVVAAFAPRIFSDYVGAVSAPPLQWAPPTLGAWLRLAVSLMCGADRRWVQFVPSALGGLLLLAWVVRRRQPWRWELVGAPLLLASSLTAVYGWTYDQVVLLPAVAALVSRLRVVAPIRRRAIIACLIVLELGLGAQLVAEISEFFHFWHPIALAGLCLLVGTRVGKDEYYDDGQERGCG